MPARALRCPAPATEALEVTRAKLLEAAGQIFAEHGFQAATVREICTRAGANVAAVNYHFRDKQGLYTEVLRESVCAVENAGLHEELARASSPEAALRLFISAMLRRMCGGDGRARALRIMAHELAQPSGALAVVVNEVMRPNYAKLRAILGAILRLDPDHDTTRLCAHSIIGQIVHYAHARPVISILWPDLSMTEARFEQVAGHIADFSLCSLRALARKNQHRPKEKAHGSTTDHRNHSTRK